MGKRRKDKICEESVESLEEESLRIVSAEELLKKAEILRKKKRKKKE